ncbi:MAG: R body protein [Sneathiella sp.]|uniref:RebB family R body protein n=1 Tax=Sneathiella sp. TaxID=1964365 RepID=UPI000C475338|nr:RebB family R body protein [Sneathiella sp.]MAZ02795.1 R body protein [Sneathiella sp.]|tara:strand:+ start:327 stop:647 length:321 start_codon:yes stop_codon:yes gene_type:complete
MPGDTPVNAQITDSVTQANVSILGDAPAIAMANAYQVFAQVVGASMQNAVSNQQGANSVDLAVTTQGTNVLYAMSTATDSKATSEILGGNPVAEALTSLQAAAKAF